eukprot:1157654-Pelagomonas_calceolata.AAC.9
MVQQFEMPSAEGASFPKLFATALLLGTLSRWVPVFLPIPQEPDTRTQLCKHATDTSFFDIQRFPCINNVHAKCGPGFACIAAQAKSAKL